MDDVTFTYGGKDYTASRRVKFLIETANGTSSYTLDRGFGADPKAAIQFYDELAAPGNRKKRLTMIDNGKRTVLSRT